MNDLTNLKSPGWQRVVAELSSAAADDKAYFDRLMRILAQVSAARKALLMFPSRAEGDEIEPRIGASWPEESAASPTADPAAAVGLSTDTLREVKNAARAAFTSGAARAFGLEKETAYYDAASTQGYILAVPLLIPAPVAAPAPGAPPQQGMSVAAVVTLLIEQRSKEAIRSTMAMAEVLAGYVHGHIARQQLRRTQAAGFALDLATRLIASINTSANFKGACIQLTNDLAKQFSLDRVALGWVRADTVRVEAISDTEHFDRRMAMVQKLQSAMDECLDQEQPVVFPQPPGDGPGGDVLLSQAIVHAHRELAAGDAKLHVCSFPLRIDERVLGIVTIETTSPQGFDLAAIEMVQAALDLVAPVLRIRRSDDRALPLRAWDSTVRAGGWVVGPKHTVWKIAAVLLFALLVFVCVFEKTYRVGAQAVLQPRTKRIISAPFEGVVKEIAKGLDPGLVVKKDDILIQLDTTELAYSRAETEGKIAHARAQREAALNERPAKTDEAASAAAQIKQYEAQIQFIDDRIKRSSIRSPIDGKVVIGEMKNKIGASVKLGDPMLEIADMSDIIVVAQVEDSDIWLVNEAFRKGTRTASILAKSMATTPFKLEVETIIPAAQAKEGKNFFEVRAKLFNPQNREIHPGSEGIVNIDTEQHSLIWIASRRVIDAVRLWIW
jgi:hypothetical protein